MGSSDVYRLNLDKFSSFFKFAVIIVGILVIFAIVPNSFAISIVGAAFSFFWFIARTKNDEYFDKIKNPNNFRNLMIVWTIVVTIAACFHAYLRHVSPGNDLSWFVQAITNASIGENLRVTSEREINLLVHHWEPILYSAIPLTFLFNGSISIVLWQGLAYIGGAIAAWKISNFLFKDAALKSLKYLTTILYLLAWLNVNPIMFDAHPPVFGTLLIVPWIFYFILTKRSSYLIILLSLILMQCGEIFLAISPVFIIYCILRNKITKFKIIFSVLIFCSGFLLIGAYQRYFGPWITGDPFPFAYRYSSIGGDGIGILKTFLSDPFLVLSQLFTIGKIKTVLKIFLYCGPFAFFAVLSKKYRVIAICLAPACLPYLIQCGLSQGMETSFHYVSSIGSIWWLLTVIGIYYVVFEAKENSKLIFIKKLVFNKQKIIPFFMILFFLNTSEWRKSLLYPFRAIVDRDNLKSEVRTYLTNIPRDKGVVFAGPEWLCPLSADYRKWLLCKGYGFPNRILPKMPLDVIVSSKEGLLDIYNNLDSQLKNGNSGIVIHALIQNNPESVGWRKVGAYAQNAEPITSKLKDIREFTIWEKIDSLH